VKELEEDYGGGEEIKRGIWNMEYGEWRIWVDRSNRRGIKEPPRWRFFID